MSAVATSPKAKAPEAYLIGHVARRTEKGGILVETLVDGVRKEAWFGEKIVKADKNGTYFVPAGAVYDKTEIKARMILPGYEEEMGWSPKEEEPAPAVDHDKMYRQVMQEQGAQKHTNGKKELMRRCVRAAKAIVDEELCCEFAVTNEENVGTKIDAILRLALSFYIDETKNQRQARIGK